MNKTINIEYFASLRDARGIDQEHWQTETSTMADLFAEIHAQYQFPMGMDSLRVACNDHFVEWTQTLKDGDKIVFIPPVNGG